MVSIICNAAIVLLAFGAVANALVWVPCSGTQTKGKANKVIVVGCETTPTCSLKKGVNASIEIDFTIDEDSTRAKSVVHGIIEHIPVPFALDNPDVCKDSGIQCPLKKGQTYVYKTNIFVKTIYPDIKLKVRWEIQDDNGDDVFCIELPAKIDGSNNTPKTAAAGSLRRNKPLLFNTRL